MRALVTKSTGLWYEVKAGEEILVARLRGKFKLEGKKITNPIAVGDWVEVQPNNQVKNEWVITNIEERTNYVIRQSPRKKGFDHLLASNIDQGVLIVTLRQPRTSLGFIDRFLITLEAFRIPSIIVFNKKDLFRKQEYELFEQLKDLYEQIGYKVLLCEFQKSADELLALLEGKISLICGHSGSGKSTLVNQLVPDATQDVKEISSFANKGVHTTTFAELFYVNNQTAIIDTPGIKELALSEIEKEELAHYFPEMRALLGKCKYHNCLHVNEPNCAIKNEIGKSISERRYLSYLSILEDNDNRR